MATVQRVFHCQAKAINTDFLFINFVLELLNHSCDILLSVKYICFLLTSHEDSQDILDIDIFQLLY